MEGSHSQYQIVGCRAHFLLTIDSLGVAAIGAGMDLELMAGASEA